MQALKAGSIKGMTEVTNIIIKATVLISNAVMRQVEHAFGITVAQVVMELVGQKQGRSEDTDADDSDSDEVMVANPSKKRTRSTARSQDKRKKRK